MKGLLVGGLLVFFIGSIFSVIPFASGFHLVEPATKVASINTDNFNEDHFTRPTFGLDHQNNKKVVDYGFKLNDKKFFLSDNFHTPFLEESINVGERNTFEATVFSERGLRVQEFLFGIPEVREAYDAEIGVEVWLNYEGEIEEIKAIQETDVIDADHILATHEQVKCRSNSSEKKCNSIRISLMFLEPLKYKTMAVKAIDFKNRYQITYLNEGIEVSGESLNPMQTVTIPSPTRNEGPIEITQSQKYSVLWTSEDGRIFERNSFGSFRHVTDSFERFHDSGEPLNRNHSEFGKLIKYEQYKAYNVFNATNLESYLPETFAYSFPEEDQRINDGMKVKLLEQEKIAQKIIEESQIQARFSDVKPDWFEN